MQPLGNTKRCHYPMFGIEYPGASSFASINNIPSHHLPLFHKIVSFLQLTKTNDLDRDLDETSAEEVNSFRTVLPVSDV